VFRVFVCFVFVFVRTSFLKSLGFRGALLEESGSLQGFFRWSAATGGIWKQDKRAQGSVSMSLWSGLRKFFSNGLNGVPLSLVLAVSAGVILIVAVAVVDPFDWFGGSGGSGGAVRTIPAGRSLSRAGGVGEDERADVEGGMGEYGVLPSFPADATAQTRLAWEVLSVGKDSSEEEKAKARSLAYRLSARFAPPAFDAKAYQDDPQYVEAYLSEPAPGRVFQTSQPGPGVPILRPVGGRFHMVVQGEEAVLKVRAPAGSPVTFTSFDAGIFQQSKLPTITVPADKAGIAKATFLATPGVINDCNILAGGPLATGQVKFVVNVSPLPKTANGE
jgi:hypothetical protein